MERKAFYHVACYHEWIGAHLTHIQAENLQKGPKNDPGVNGLLILATKDRYKTDHEFTAFEAIDFENTNFNHTEQIQDTFFSGTGM